VIILVPTCFCIGAIYWAIRGHDYAYAGVLSALVGFAIAGAFRIMPLGKILDSWAFLIFIEIVLFTTGGFALASIYWVIKAGAYAIALMTLVAGGGDLLLAISMALQARNVLKQRR
jgi:hypothetical protein